MATASADAWPRRPAGIPMRLIIDTDPGVDDALALILAMRSPGAVVEAITTVSGNVPVAQATRNALTVLDLLDLPRRPPVASGAEAPLERSPVTATEVHGADGLGELGRFRNPDGGPRYPSPRGAPAAGDAVSMILDTIRRFPDEVTLVALGPLTNVARALLKDPDGVRRLRRLVVMGGAVAVPGNVTPVAEFNIFGDPQAARLVLRSGLPVTLVPLDVTRRVRVAPGDLAAVPGRVGQFLRDATGCAFRFAEAQEGGSWFTLHDPLAVAVALDPTLVTAEPLALDVEVAGELTMGMTVADRRPRPGRGTAGAVVPTCLSVDVGRFLDLFRQWVCQGSS